MLFIDNNHPQVFEWQKESRSRANNDADVASCGGAPNTRAFARAHARMPFRRRGAKTRSETIKKLHREGNLRHHHQGLAATSQGGGDGFEINLRFAGACDALEQEGLKVFCLYGLRQTRGGEALCWL